MGRPITTTEPQSKRSVQITFGTVAEKGQMQAHAKRRGASLAGLLKMLLAADLATHPAPTPGPGGAGAA